MLFSDRLKNHEQDGVIFHVLATFVKIAILVVLAEVQGVLGGSRVPLDIAPSFVNSGQLTDASSRAKLLTTFNADRRSSI